ncbi:MULTISPECIES: RagB/SusD family nutrient uptake outer membrane protein [Bacteroides]|uniref:RagB/SusD family nutrient uptake outer membrane protein n=1 Tax=Bacteroides TaxID=816 RepID=UPI00319E23B8
MKILKNIMLGTLAVAAVSACNTDFLEQKALSKIYEENVFTDSVQSLGMVNALYNDINYSYKQSRFGNGGYEIGLDEAEPYKDISQWSYMFLKGAVNPSNANKTAWTLTYEKIREANLFLKNMGTIPVTKPTLDCWEAQVRFLRAWFIFQQVKHYGGVPLVGDKIFTDQETINLPRNTYEDCINYIVSECDAAAKVLPYKMDFNTESEKGRATKGAALALKARVLLYAASPLVNCARSDDPEHLISYGDTKNERWKAAYEAALVLMNKGTKPDDPKEFTYELYKETNPYFYNLFLQKEPCVENIFSFWPQTGDTKTNMELETACNPPSRQTRYAGRPTDFPTQQLVDAFPMADGTSIEDAKQKSESDPYYYPGDGSKMYTNRDPRLEATVAYNGMMRPMQSFPNAELRTYTGVIPSGNNDVSSAQKDGIYAQNATRTGYYRMKGLSKDIHSSGELYRPSMLIRYAEILLNAAEAANEMDDRASLMPDVYEWLRAIRERAGILKGGPGNEYGIKDNMSKEEMRKFIRNERRIELAFEEHRYWDVRRWKAFEEEGLVHFWTEGMEITRAADGTFSYRRIQVEERSNPENLYWWPIPASEITKSPAVKQNPGY